MRAYYNEFDPFAAQWLRNLVGAGLIAPGDVDQRSIVDVRPDDLRGYGQCHFFAGIGGWSRALRLAGWPDDRPVWTGSCPCQPFSGAGRRRGVADERHLWPEFFRLIRERGPVAVLGEQVASPDGLAWLDLVHADLEDAGYACGAVDLCAAGVGAPHIRQRLWWGAERLDHTAGQRLARAFEDAEAAARNPARVRVPRGGCRSGGMADMHGDGCDQAGAGFAAPRHDGAFGNRAPGGVGDAGLAGSQGRAGVPCGEDQRAARPAGLAGGVADAEWPGPSDGFWREADWLLCRDERWRPVEPGAFPLADGIPRRVGRLRTYGNAIVPQVAAQFIRAWRDVRAA